MELLILPYVILVMTRLTLLKWRKLNLERTRVNVNLDEKSNDRDTIGFTKCVFQTAIFSRVPVYEMKLQKAKKDSILK